MDKLSRRTFLKLSAAVGAGGLTVTACSRSATVTHHTAQTEPLSGLSSDIWLHVGTDNRVTIWIAESEMGQGVMTSLAMLAAEELDADWRFVRSLRAPLAPGFGNQSTGGSSSVREAWDTMRRAGATARQLLVEAAARRWNVEISEITTDSSVVFHVPTQRQLSYGELAVDASRVTAPRQVSLKPISERRLLGKNVVATDIEPKLRGLVRYGIDVKLPQQWKAVVVQNPRNSGRALSVDDSGARALNGFHAVRIFDDFVAVIARDTWAALQAARVIKINWPAAATPALDAQAMRERLNNALQKPGALVQQVGDSREPAQVLHARYFVPYQAHATPEPPNASAHINAHGGEIWTGTQSPTRVRDEIAATQLSGFARTLDKIQQRADWGAGAISVHPVYLGGGFGRRLESDYALQAAELSKALGGAVQTLWSREEDIQHDFYRPASLHALSGALDAEGQPIYWRHHIAGPSIDESDDPGSTQTRGYDNKMVEGARHLPYRIPNIGVSAVIEQLPLRCGLWRSVGHSANAFARESFIDELAHQARKDPLQFRLSLLPKDSPHARVLQAVADAAHWGSPPPAGHARGLAVHASFGSVVAQIAEISIRHNAIRVHKFYCAIDCGFAVNPDGVRAQMEGSVVFGLTATLKGSITLQDGRVAQSNFHDYPLLRFSEMPVVETVIIASEAPPQGAGEPGVPPVAPAVANAVFAATGRRIRELPLQISG